MGCSGFPVTVRLRDVVAAVLPVQEHRLPMSNLDLLLPPLDFGIFFCYNTKNRETSTNIINDQNMAVGALKKALSQALVSFYPFSGEIVQNGLGEPEILCNNRGVDFAHAYADVELKDIDLHRPDLSVHAKLVPLKVHGVLSVQVTDLKCGGLFIGCTFDHRAADAHSANMFLTAWAHIAQSNPTTLLPSFRRSLFSPRRPPRPHTSSLDKHYAPISPPPPPAADQDHLVSRIYRVRSSEIDRLQSQTSHNGTRRTKFESFSAFLWKTLSAAAGDPSRTMRLGVVVDGRTRMGGETSLGCYVGNVLSVPHVEASAGDLRETSLAGVAEVVHECIAAASTAEHFRELVDWVELRRPRPAVVKVYCKGGENDGAAVVVSSGLGFPVGDLDFGWGGPVFGSYHFAWGGETGYVMPMRSANDNGDWIVYMHLTGRHLDLLEARAPHVFSPFSSSHHLDL